MRSLLCTHIFSKQAISTLSRDSAPTILLVAPHVLEIELVSSMWKGKVVLLGDFNARVGRSAQLDDVVGMFGENTCNASGNRLLSFLNEVELMICNGRKLVTEPEWTRIRPSLKQKSIIDYIITDAQLLEVSGNVHVDGTDIGSSDHLLVWMEDYFIASTLWWTNLCYISN